MTSEAKRWLAATAGKSGLAWVGLAAGAIVLMLGMFGKDETMKKLEKIREALRFATDAAVPRVQAEATIVLAEVASELLDELREQGMGNERALALWKDASATTHKENAETLALWKEICDMLAKAFGVEAPAAAEGEAPAQEPAP